MSSEVLTFLKWLTALFPELVELFKSSGGDTKKSMRAMRKAYDLVHAEQAAQMQRQRLRPKDKDDG